MLPIHDTVGCRCSCGTICASPGKHPRAVHGVHDASTDKEQIEAWWSQWPTANVGIAAGPASIDVLDIDIKPSGDGFTALERLRRTGLVSDACGLVQTPSGGLHLYFRPTGQGNSTIPGQFVDLRGAGGYVLAPPSRINDGRYTWLDWRPEASGTLDWNRVRHLLVPRPRAPTSPGMTSPCSVTALARWLRRQPATPGNRNNALYWAACCALNNGATPGDLEQIRDAGIEIGLAQEEVDRTLRSAVHRNRKREENSMITLADYDAPHADGAPLLDELRTTLRRYVILPSPEAEVAITLWIAATHAPITGRSRPDS